MPWSRARPSPRYTALLAQYRRLHVEGERFLGVPAELTFPGKNLKPQATRIRALIQRTGATTVLDYGCGKGTQYNPWTVKDAQGRELVTSVMDYWGVDEVACYDPGYAPYAALPEGRFDGVVCTDVLEHCPREDLPWIVEELFDFAGAFVFANVASYPAGKHLPSGENAHCTIEPVAWWEDLLGAAAARHPHVLWEVWVSVLEGEGASASAHRTERRIGNV